MRLYQPSEFDEDIAEVRDVAYFGSAFCAHPEFMKHRMSQIHDPVECVDLVPMQALVKYADVNICIKDSFFLHF